MTTALPSAKSGNPNDALLARIHNMEKERRSTTRGPDSPETQQTIRGLQWHPSRPALNPVVQTMDREFIGARRQLSWNTVRDIYQNLSLIVWMLDVHAVYTSQFEFQPWTQDVVYDRELREWMKWRTDKKKIDVRRRFGFEEMFSVFAILQLLDGYCPIVKSEGGRFQIFEAWNMARGAGVEADELKYGVKVNNNGVVLDPYKAIDYIAIATGDTSGTLTHQFLAHHEQVILDGWSTRAADTLWESPINSILDKARDYTSADEYNLIKAKLHSMFVVFRTLKLGARGGADFPTRENSQGIPIVSTDGITEQGVKPNPQPPPLQEIRTGTILTGEEGDKVEFLESRTPSQEYVAFVKKVARDMLLIAGIPYSFYDSESANYSSMKADSVRYSTWCRPRRLKNARNQREGYKHIINAGLSEDMPMWGGKYTVDTLPYRLVPTGVPYILDPSKELPAIIAKLNARLMDFEAACDELGSGSFYDIIDRTSSQLAYAKEKGVPVNLGTVKITLAGEEASQEGTEPTGKTAAADETDE